MAKKLSYKDFLKSFEFAPRLTIELIVEDESGAIVLLKRTSDPYNNYWHLPGGFLLKDEKISNCVKRLAKEELNIDYDSEYKKLGVFETIKGDPRGHIVHYVVRLSEDKITKGKYFKTIPQNTIPYQKTFLQELGYKAK